MNEQRRTRTVISVAVVLVALVAIAVVGIALAGGDGDETTVSSPPQTPSGGATPSQGALPPGIAECLADRGFELESPDELHSAVPQEVLDQCFNALHRGGGGP
jgi:hypothetical protein